MNPIIRAVLIHTLVAMPIVSRTALAANPQSPQPLLATPGKLLFEDDFSRAAMAPKWKVEKGLWVLKDGVVRIEDNPADHHAASARIDPAIPFKDLVAEFSFKLDGAKNLHLILRDSNYKGSHVGQIAQTIITPSVVHLMDMKCGIMKNENFEIVSNPKSSAAARKEIEEKVKDKMTTSKARFDPSGWHAARVEVVGDEMLISIDDKPAGYIKSEGIDHATKNVLVLSVSGASVEIKNMKLWQAAPAADWAAHRAEVLAGLKN